MTSQRFIRFGLLLILCVGVAACGARRNAGSGNTGLPVSDAPPGGELRGREVAGFNYDKSSIWDVFGPSKADQTVQVNRFIWNATLDVLNFLPVQSVDPFTGVIVTGYGTPPGGGRSYRATVHITDPALDARSLRVALQSSGGRAVSASTARAVEDAILSRARQMRISDNKL